jgi:hypothetical protein
MNMEQKKKIKDMTPEEKTEYNRLQKRESRERERQEQLAKRIPNSRDYELPQVQQRTLSEHSRNIQATINTELGKVVDEYVVDAVACVLFGFENNFTQKVSEPFGVLVGGYFPDAAASTTIESVHRFPMLLQSATFADLYQKFLSQIAKWNNQTHGAYSTLELIADLNRELAGTYVLPSPASTPVVPAPVPIESSASAPGASDKDIRERGREQLLRQLDPSIPPVARRYPDGL